MSIEIIPAFLVHSEKEFEEKLRLVEGVCKTIQIDVLDGSLFPNTSWFDAKAIGAFETNVQMEIHLMVENPIPIVEDFKKHVGTFTRAIVHAEIHRPLGAIVSHIRDILHLEVGVALNPETPLTAIEEVLHSIDQLTIMGVHPGFQGQAFGDEEHLHDPNAIFEKIRAAKNHRSDLIVEIDGGVTDALIRELAHFGANRLCAGSLIFKTPDPHAKLLALNDSLSKL